MHYMHIASQCRRQRHDHKLTIFYVYFKHASRIHTPVGNSGTLGDRGFSSVRLPTQGLKNLSNSILFFFLRTNGLAGRGLPTNGLHCICGLQPICLCWASGANLFTKWRNADYITPAFLCVSVSFLFRLPLLYPLVSPPSCAVINFSPRYISCGHAVTVHNTAVRPVNICHKFQPLVPWPTLQDVQELTCSYVSTSWSETRVPGASRPPGCA
jgi:hypothetical protein